MTAEQRAAARARCQKATPGPRAVTLKRKHWAVGGGPDNKGVAFAFGGNNANAQLIANSRTDLPLALDAIDAAEKRIAELEAQILALTAEIQRTVGRP